MSEKYLKKVDAAVRAVKPLKGLVSFVANRFLPTMTAYAAEYEQCEDLGCYQLCTSYFLQRWKRCRTCIVVPGGTGCSAWSSPMRDGCCW